MIAQPLKSLIVVLALEWELCSQDPFIFCYRIGCMVFVFHQEIRRTLVIR
jgi:hypothetical protein